jgi:hypothetical protein
MAITPNTDFTSGQILTAQQQNNFPRGLVALAQSVTTQNTISTEVLSTGMSATFTAVANRNYKVIYREGTLTKSAAIGNVDLRVRLTNLAGTEVAAGTFQMQASVNQTAEISIIRTFTAGSITLVGTAASVVAGTVNLRRDLFGATLAGASLEVYDMGTA